MLNHDWVLTAAHLFDDYSRSEDWSRLFIVTLGKHAKTIFSVRNNVSKTNWRTEIKLYQKNTITDFQNGLFQKDVH